MDDFYIGTALLVKWTSPNADTQINRRTLYHDDPQNGYAFGFLGLTLSGGIWPTYCKVLGLCQLVIITDYEPY